MSKTIRSFFLFIFSSSARKVYLEKDLSVVLQNFYDLGPIARFCLQYTEAEIKGYLVERKATIRSIGEPGKAKEIFGRLLDSANDLSLDATSHKICLIRRFERRNVDDPRIIVNPMSESVARALASQLEMLDEAEVLGLWRKFSRLPDARGMSGSIFEAYIHQQFRKPDQL